MTTPSSLSGQRLGAYDVGPLIGAGGMGEVYRARDSKLNRDVAIKVLLPAVVNDTERLARFRREAQTLAALNHPGIAQIHGLEDSDSGPFLVMELVDGPTLADRLAAGAIPVDEATAIARQIVDALEAAHDRGIVHRDLKPANIKVCDDGTVKVLDFGLAKALDPSSGVGEPGTAANSPTITTPAMTAAGLILGTAAYMSPEQAKGRVVDKRTDVWAFGCVLYEMLTGRRAFDGEDVTDTIAAVVRGEPNWNALPKETPSHVRLLLTRCLEKDRRARIGDISVVRFLLDERVAPLAGPSDNSAVAVPIKRARLVIAALALGVMGGAALLAAIQRVTAMPAPPPQPIRFKFTPPSANYLAIQGNDRDVAISPDGSQIVYRAFDTGRAQAHLVVRAINALEVRPLPGTDLARNPVISPDGRWVAFGAQGELRKVAISGGSSVTICKITGVLRGLGWTEDGQLLFSTSGEGRLMRVPDGGGTPVPLTSPDRAANAIHTFPQVLPGNQTALFTNWTGNFETSSVQSVDLRTGEVKILIRGATDASYVETGFLIYMTSSPARRTGTLRAVRFDPQRLEVVGDSAEVVADAAVVFTGAGNAAISRRGDLVYVPAGDVVDQVPSRRLVWVDRRGRETALSAPVRPYALARLSPDGNKIAVDVRDEMNDIWVWDLARQTLSALNREPAQDLSPMWTSDGSRIIWTSTRAGGNPNLYWQPFDGTGTPERLTVFPSAQFPTSMTPDGSTLIVFAARGPYQALHRIALAGPERKAEPLLAVEANQYGGEISPDGRWLAYHSDESGQYQVFVRPYPEVGRARLQISTTGGSRAAWARNGGELFYLDAAGLLTSVEISTLGQTPTAGTPKTISATRYHPGASVLGFDLRAFDVSRDGRLLMIKDDERAKQNPASPPGMVVVLNWAAEINERLSRR